MVTLSDLRTAQGLLDDLRARGDSEKATAMEHLISTAAEALATQSIYHPPDLLTTGQAARALGVSVQTIKNWATAGKLTTTKLGGRTMVLRESLVAYLDGIRSARVGVLPQPARESAEEVEQRAFIRVGYPPELIRRLRELVKLMEDRKLTPDESAELDRLEQQSAHISAERLRQWARGQRVAGSPEV